MISPFAGPMSVADAHELAAALKAVADPARLRIVSLLAAAAAAPLSVAELTARTWLQQPTISHHLKILARAGLGDREEHWSSPGTFVGSENRLNLGAFADLAGLLVPPKGSPAGTNASRDRAVAAALSRVKQWAIEHEEYETQEYVGRLAAELRVPLVEGVAP